MKKIIICKNSEGNKGYIHPDECSNCYFLHTELREHFLDDVVECRCPITVKKNDKIEFIHSVRIVPKRNGKKLL